MDSGRITEVAAVMEGRVDGVLLCQWLALEVEVTDCLSVVCVSSSVVCVKIQWFVLVVQWFVLVVQWFELVVQWFVLEISVVCLRLHILERIAHYSEHFSLSPRD